MLLFVGGPGPNSFELLATLKAKSAQATFGYLGRDSLQYFGAAATEAYKSGHSIASNGWAHLDFPAYPEATILKDLTDNEEMISSRIAAEPAWIVPPYGDIDRRTLQTIHSFGAKALVWTLDSMDSSGLNGYQLIKSMLARGDSEIRAADKSFEGPIVLFHDTRDETVRAIGQYIDLIRDKKGYTLVDLPTCAGIAADQVYKPKRPLPALVASPTTTALKPMPTAPNYSTTSDKDGTAIGSFSRSSLPLLSVLALVLLGL